MKTPKDDGFLRLTYHHGTAFFSRFRAFIRRGNVVDLAVGVVIGAAFGKIVSSLVGDLLMPPLGLVLARLDFRQLRLVLKEAQGDQPAVTLNYGVFLSNILDFLIVALVVFLLIQILHRFHEEPPASPSTKECRFCASQIPEKAIRCPLCTSELEAPAPEAGGTAL